MINHGFQLSNLLERDFSMESLLAVLVVYGVCIFIYFANEMHHSKLIEDLPKLRAKLDPRLKFFDRTLMSFCGGTPGHRTSGIHHDTYDWYRSYKKGAVDLRYSPANIKTSQCLNNPLLNEIEAIWQNCIYGKKPADGVLESDLINIILKYDPDYVLATYYCFHRGVFTPPVYEDYPNNPTPIY